MSLLASSIPNTSSTLMINDFILRGHFVGKTGMHIDGKLLKQRALDNKQFLSVSIALLYDEIKKYQSPLLVAEQTGGAILARALNQQFRVPSLLLEKQSVDLREPIAELPIHRDIIIIEDNVITGASIRRVTRYLHSLNLNPTATISLFASRDDLLVKNHIISLLPLPIHEWPPQSCPLCAVGSRIQKI